MMNYDDLYKSLYPGQEEDYSLLPKVQTPTPSLGTSGDWITALTKAAGSLSSTPSYRTPGFNPDAPLPMGPTQDEIAPDWRALIPTTQPGIKPVQGAQAPSPTATGEWAEQRRALMNKLNSQLESQKGTYEQQKAEIGKVGVQELADRIGALVGKGYIRQADISARYDKKRQDAIAQLTKEFDRDTAMLVTQLDFGQKVHESEQADQKFTWDVAEEQRKAAKDIRESKVWEDEQAKKEREKDPNSQESELARQLATKLSPQLASQVQGMSAEQINGMIPILKTMYEVEERNYQKEEDRKLRAQDMQDRIEDRKARREMAAMVREDRVLQKELAAQAKIEAEVEKQLPKLGKDLADGQKLIEAYNNVDSKLGFRLSDFDPKTGLVGGKEVDIPGVSVWGIGRLNFYSSEARDLHSAISSIFNQTLKDRSGSAVTTMELENLRNEFNQGKFSNEKEMLGALQEYRKQTAIALKQVEARYDPRVVERYSERGGTTTADIPMAAPSPILKTPTGQKQVSAPVPAGYTRMVDPSGAVKAVPTANVEAAKKAGWRVQ